MDSKQEIPEGRACCAHLRVKYDPIPHGNFSFSERWLCEDCKAQFVPIAKEGIVSGQNELVVKLQSQLASAREQVEALNGQMLDKQKLYTDAILRGDDLEAQLAAVTGKVTCKHCGREIEHFTVCGVPSNAWRHKETCTGGCPGLPTEAEPRTQSRQGSK